MPKGLFAGKTWKEYLLSLGTERALSRPLTLEAVLKHYHGELKKDPFLMEKAEEVLRVMKNGYSLKKQFVKGDFQLRFPDSFEAVADLIRQKEAEGFRVEIDWVKA